jgi:hypothetical protein
MSSAMSFQFDEPDKEWHCKKCGDEITLKQYQRAWLCDSCMSVANLTPAQVEQYATKLCYPGWEEDFLLRLNEEEERKRRLR